MDYLFTFLEGFASFISPCVLPLLPLYISYFAGKESKKHKAFINSIAFVLGFTVVFTLMAIIVNGLGTRVSQFLRYIKIIFGVIVIILGLSYTGLFKIGFLAKLPKLIINVENLNIFKAFLFGMCFSISISPCVGTFLTSALLLIASRESLVKGVVLILIYCLGLGIPFIISSLLIERLKNTFDFIKKYFGIIKIIFGIVLVCMGIYIIFF